MKNLTVKVTITVSMLIVLTALLANVQHIFFSDQNYTHTNPFPSNTIAEGYPVWESKCRYPSQFDEWFTNQEQENLSILEKNSVLVEAKFLGGELSYFGKELSEIPLITDLDILIGKVTLQDDSYSVDLGIQNQDKWDSISDEKKVSLINNVKKTIHNLLGKRGLDLDIYISGSICNPNGDSYWISNVLFAKFSKDNEYQINIDWEN